MKPVKIEQPESINEKDGKWFFQRGISGGGAVYGVTLDKSEVEIRCSAKLGAGSLLEFNGEWYWQRVEE